MTSRGRALLVGADAALAAELARSLAARGFEAVPVPDARAAAAALGGEAFVAALADLARVPAGDVKALEGLRAARPLAVLGVEAAAALSPAVEAPLRRLHWPLPAGFVDQLRSAPNHVALLVEPTLFVTQGVQSALRQAGVVFYQVDGTVGALEMVREQAGRDALARARPEPKAGGFWERLSGASEPGPSGAALGRVGVIKFEGSWDAAAQFDARLRESAPGVACYLAAAVDPVRAAAQELAAGRTATLPREAAARAGEALEAALAGTGSAARGKERVLLVDNDVPTLSRLAEALMAAGYEVATAVKGEEALALTERGPFALAAIGGSALEATKLSGANLALKLRERDKDLRLLLMVDQFPVQDALKGVSRAVELGLDDALLKPVDASRLALSIERALERRFLLLENARLLREVQESARKLAQVNGFQTKFFATVAHDVKNPLTAILGYAEVLSLRLAGKPDELRCASHIHSAAKTLNLLVSDLVDLAAIESGKLRVEIGELDLAQVLAEVKSRVDVVAQKKGLVLTVQVPGDLPLLRGDPHRIGQVVQNLCTNAVQYTREGGKVSIEASLQPGWAVVGVRDTGIGISKEDLPRVWERFFQTREAQDMRKAGFGLGLKIAREIVQLHGGDMGIQSEPGVGSFFYFRLPVPPAAA